MKAITANGVLFSIERLAASRREVNVNSPSAKQDMETILNSIVATLGMARCEKCGKHWKQGGDCATSDLCEFCAGKRKA